VTVWEVGRAITAVAALLFVSAVALAVAPVPGTAVELAASPKHVDCGTMFRESAYSLDEGCEDAAIRRTGRAILAFLPAGPVGLTGLLLMRRARRPRGELPAERGRAW